MNVLIILLILLAIVLALVGIVGAVVPSLPGAPLCYAALFIDYFVFSPCIITPMLLLVMLVLTLIVEALEYVAPIWLTKLGGGSKAATWGSTIGVIVGLFFLPSGLIWGPFLGAFIGEMIATSKFKLAVRVSLMSLISFLLTTGLELILSLVMTYYSIRSMIEAIIF